MAIIFHVSSQSEPLPRVTSVIWDKELHLAEYGALGLLFCRALHGEALGWLRAIFLASLLTSAYGATDEWHQAYVPRRTAETTDWLADTIGAGLGATVYAVARRAENPTGRADPLGRARPPEGPGRG